MSDEEIMSRVQSGNLRQLSVLFERYKKPIYGFFFRLTYNQGLSDDFTQTVFERIIRYRKSYNKEYSFKSWLFQIARNVHFDHFRHQKKILQPLTEQSQIPVLQTSVLAQIEHREQLQNLEKALAMLTPAYREVLLLTRYQKLKYEEVGRIIGCSEGAVKLKVYRAIQQLRRLFFKIDTL